MTIRPGLLRLTLLTLSGQAQAYSRRRRQEPLIDAHEALLRRRH